jgi:DNA gyrase inhibitor GyrI
MSDLEVGIVRLEPMRVACVRAISKTPERDAWEKLRTWASPKGLLNDLEKHPIFGFNNPNPSPDRKEYGYEFWIRIDACIDTEGEIGIKEFPGGLYAATKCKLQGDPSGSVAEVWKKLWDWAQISEKYRWRRTHELEQTYNPQAAEDDIILGLYLPIEERSEYSGTPNSRTPMNAD